LDRVPELRREYGPFQLIYVDPPFNAGGIRKAREAQGPRAGGAYAYVDQWGGLENFLNMLEPRLEVLRDALSPEGSLWLQLDYRAIHDVKVCLDRVFGPSAFAGEVIWVPGNGGKRRSGPSVTHQTILIYRRGAQMVWNGDDPALREPFSDTSLRMHFKQTDEQGRNYRERTINGKSYRYYADEGRRIGSVWLDCPSMTANTPLTSETTGYPTQKPESLLERVIRAASTPDGAVLDPMCGSGTTVAVAARLGRAFAGCDLNELACRLAAERVSRALAAPTLGTGSRDVGPSKLRSTAPSKLRSVPPTATRATR
jgi:site-specific DNA-methyltransferase (adenine-specific)